MKNSTTYDFTKDCLDLVQIDTMKFYEINENMNCRQYHLTSKQCVNLPGTSRL